jgi:tRNA (guanine37-N1)-methyltransferase
VSSAPFPTSPHLRVDILTLFPQAFDGGPLDVSIIRRARDAGLLDLAVHDIRAHTTDRHRSVDDYPFGGGQGMVMRVDVLDRAIEHVRALHPSPPLVVYLTPQGQRLDDRLVRELAAVPRLLLLCGRYEGVDERVVDHLVDREVSIGDFILTGGELAAMVLIDAVARHLPGALGDAQSPAEESFAGGLLEHPQYTRPAAYRGWRVPPVLLSGDHAAIERWRAEQRQLRTARRRPDLLAAAPAYEPPGRKVAGARLRTYRHPDDLEPLLALWRDAGPALQLGPGDDATGVGRLAALHPSLLVVAQRRRRLVGAVAAGFDGRRGTVHHLAVAPPERGNGIGSALLEEVEHRLRLVGCLRAHLRVPESADPGLASFYEARGWQRNAAADFQKDLAY